MPATKRTAGQFHDLSGRISGPQAALPGSDAGRIVRGHQLRGGPASLLLTFGTSVESVHDAAGAARVELSFPRLGVLGVEATWLGHGALAERNCHVVDFGGFEQLVPRSEEMMLGVGAEVGEAAGTPHLLQLFAADQVKC